MGMPARKLEFEEVTVEDRLGRLRSTVEHIQSDVSEIKGDIRRLDNKIDRVADKVDALKPHISNVRTMRRTARIRRNSPGQRK
jgi:archaellum component FlaC